MEAASGQDRIVRRRIRLRWFAAAMAGLLAIAPASTRSDDVSPTPVPAQPLESLGNGAPSSARASGPVVTAAPRRETAIGTPDPPAGAAGTIASDTDGSSGNAPQPPRAMPVVKPIAEDPLRLPAEPARVEPIPVDNAATGSAPARLKSVVNSASQPQPLALQKFGDLPPLPPLTVARLFSRGSLLARRRPAICRVLGANRSRRKNRLRDGSLKSPPTGKSR